MMTNLALLTWIKVLTKFLPNYAYTLLKRHLFPAPSCQENRWPRTTKRISYKTKYGKARVYTVGAGECVWIVCGRENAHHSKSLVEKLVNYGYSCQVIEFVHQDNPKNKSNRQEFSHKDKFISLPQWINVFDVLVKHIEEPSHVITVGIGSSVVGNSRWIAKYTKELTLVSPILDLYAGLEHFFRQHTLPIYLLKRLAHEVYFTDKVHLRSLKVTEIFEQFKGNLAVYYSPKDSTSSVKAIESLTQNNNQKVVEFKGASIEKIISSRSLFHVVQRNNATLDVAV